MKKFFVAFLALMISITCYAETRYTTGPEDSVLRSGPSEYAEAEATIVPGTQVSIIGTDRSSGYALVITQDKYRGWVPLHELTTNAPTQPVLLQPKPVTTTSDESTNPTTESQADTSQPQATTQEPIKAPDAKTLANKSYTSDVKDKLNALASASAANPNSLVKLTPKEMTNYVAIQRENRAWFITGAGVLIIGMLIGAFVARITRRRRSSWD